MNLKDEIFRVFGPAVFHRPLFYSYPGGLRFELSEGDSHIEQFLVAHYKSTKICKDIFGPDESLVVCLCAHSTINFSELRDTIRSIRLAEIPIPTRRWVWSERTDPEEWYSETQPVHNIYLAFEVSVRFLERLLWCALAKYLCIRPRLNCDLSLLSIDKGLAVLPYDDRGMDVVGPNKNMLLALYNMHGAFLFDYDRKIMDDTFSKAAG